MFSLSFTSFFIILVASLLFSLISRKFHLPWVISLIVAGVVIGDSGFQLVQEDTVLAFFAEVGLIFLMFLAGLETKLSTIKTIRAKAIPFSIVNGVIPFGCGVAVSWWFGFRVLPSLLMGAVFMSTSVAVIIPFLETHKKVQKMCGSLIVAGTLLSDLIALLLLSLYLQLNATEAALPLPAFYISAVAIIILIRLSLPKIRAYFHARHGRFFHTTASKVFETELRVAVALLLGAVVLFDILGLHAVIGGFVAGLLLSEILESDELLNKFRTLGYGLFVPIFFVTVGITLNLDSVLHSSGGIWFAVVAAAIAILSKVSSGYLIGRLERYPHRVSMFLGWATVPRLSTSFAIAYTGVQFGLINELFATNIIIVSIASTFIGSLMMNHLAPQATKKKSV